jgi:cellulose biosynthesis protein BcsQ
MFIAVISPRSTGKTTIIAWLLHALHERGYPVTGFDADESRQLLRWKQGAPGSCYPFEVRHLASTRFHEEAPRLLPSGHIGGVDCGHLENHAEIGWSVFRVTDLVIIACAPTTSDLERMDELPMDAYLDKARAKREDGRKPPTWVLLCRAQPGTRSPAGVREDLEKDGLKVFTTVIPAIQRYANTGEGTRIRAARSHFDTLVTEMESQGLICR